MPTCGAPACPGRPYSKVRAELATQGLRDRWAERQGGQWEHGRDGCPWRHYCQKSHLTIWPYDFRTRNVPRQTGRQTDRQRDRSPGQDNPNQLLDPSPTPQPPATGRARATAPGREEKAVSECTRVWPKASRTLPAVPPLRQ